MSARTLPVRQAIQSIVSVNDRLRLVTISLRSASFRHRCWFPRISQSLGWKLALWFRRSNIQKILRSINEYTFRMAGGTAIPPLCRRQQPSHCSFAMASNSRWWDWMTLSSISPSIPNAKMGGKHGLETQAIGHSKCKVGRITWCRWEEIAIQMFFPVIYLPLVFALGFWFRLPLSELFPQRKCFRVWISAVDPDRRYSHISCALSWRSVHGSWRSWSGFVNDRPSLIASLAILAKFSEHIGSMRNGCSQTGLRSLSDYRYPPCIPLIVQNIFYRNIRHHLTCQNYNSSDSWISSQQDGWVWKITQIFVNIKHIRSQAGQYFLYIEIFDTIRDFEFAVNEIGEHRALATCMYSIFWERMLPSLTRKAP